MATFIEYILSRELTAEFYRKSLRDEGSCGRTRRE
jgi:hypothetical protein